VSDSASLRGVLTLLERYGSVVVPAGDLDELASGEARAALHASGVISSAAAAATWPCDVRGCSREVRSNHDGARRPLVAVCCQAPPACAPVELGFDDVAQKALAADVLVGAACALFGARADAAALAKLREPRALGDACAPALVAASTEPPRDVFWVGSPRALDLGGFCARRERVLRGTLVLVPTADRVPPDVAARFAPGEHVEVRALADTLTVREGTLAAVQGHAVRPPPSEAPEPEPALPPAAHGIAAVLGVQAWRDMRISFVDGTTVRIEAKGKTLLRTFVELGFVDARKRQIVTPVTAWALLLAFCKKGYVKPSEYGALGKPYGAKKAMEGLNRAMRASFGLEERPIAQYDKRRGQWTAKFRVAGG
jgi:hypothetical protein